MTTLLAATRPTRRDAFKHPWRSLAAILLVAVPMFLVSFFLTYDQSINNAASYPGSQVQAHYDGEGAYQLLQENLPEDFHLELFVNGYPEVSFGDEEVNFFVVQSTNVQQASFPADALDVLGATIGDTVTIHGTPVEVQSISPTNILLPEGTLFSLENFSESETFSGTWYFPGSNFTEENRQALEAVGFEVNDYRRGPISVDPNLIPSYIMGFLSTTILAVVALMLISPVFTISASRQTRTFALLASQGATPRHIRWAVLTYGLFAGLVGASIGLVLGQIGIYGWWKYTYPEFSLTTPWLVLVGFWALAIIASTIAAFLPAVFVSRSSIINGIYGGISDKIIRWSPRMLIGPIVLIAAAVIALFIGDGEWGGVVKQLCFLAAVIALPASVPAVLWALGRLPGLTFKLATRDMLRRSMHSIPAIGALAAVIMLGTFMQTTGLATQASDREATASVYPEAVFLRGDTQIPGLMGQKIDVYGDNHGFGIYELDVDVYSANYVPALTSFFGGPVIATPKLLDMFGVHEQADIYAPSTYNSGLQEYAIYPGDETYMLDTAAVLPALYSHVLLSPESFEEMGGQTEFLGTIVLPQELDDQTVQAINRSQDAHFSHDVHDSPLASSAALTAVAIVVVSLVIVLANRKRQQHALIAIGATPGTIRKVNALNAALLALVGGVMGIVSGWIAALLSGTTDQIVDGTILEYGTLEHMMLPWSLLVSLLVVAPLVCAVVGAIASPSGRHQEASI